MPYGSQVDVAVARNMRVVLVIGAFLGEMEQRIAGVVVEGSRTYEAPLRREQHIQRRLPANPQIVAPTRIHRALGDVVAGTTEQTGAVEAAGARIRSAGLVPQVGPVQRCADGAPVAGQ